MNIVSDTLSTADAIAVTHQHRIDQALRSVALGISAATADDIFSAIARHVAELLGADFSLVSRISDTQADALATLAINYRGAPLPNITYELAGTPCAHVFDRTFYHVERDAQTIFPGEDTLIQFNLDSYAGYPLFGSDGRALGLIAVAHSAALPERDVIETLLKIFSVRAAAELERIAAEQSYRAIFDASEDAIFVHDFASGAIVDVNPKACSSYGYTHAEMLALPIDALGDGNPPYSGDDARQWLERARHSPQRFEWLHRTKDGSPHWVEVILKRANIGSVERIVAITRDINERKHGEEKRAQLEKQLRQAQRMEAIGHLTGGIAHDFNNLLTGVLGYTVMAQERASSLGDEKLRNQLGRVLHSAEKARDLIQQMLTFSRGGRGAPQTIAAENIVGDFLKLIESTLPRTIAIEHHFAPSLPPVFIDPVCLEQVLMNLCVNARDAMDGSGRLRITLTKQNLHEVACTSCLERFGGDYLALTVSDTGPGITAGAHARMFEPFFSTKDSGKGSGMGLALVHGIVHEAGGHVLVDSMPGAGAAFRVLLPPSAQHCNPAAPSAATHEQTPSLRGRVAIVDDQPEVGEFMLERLRSWGIDATLFTDAPAAATQLGAQIDDWDIVILDQSMPRLSGIEVAQQLLQRRPALPVLLYTGYADTLTEIGVRGTGIRALLRKPIDERRLYLLLQQLLPGDTNRQQNPLG